MIDSGREYLTGLSTMVVLRAVAALTDDEIGRLTDQQVRGRLARLADLLDETALARDFLDDFVTAARLSVTDPGWAVQYLLPPEALDHRRVHQMLAAGTVVVGARSAQRHAGEPASVEMIGNRPVATLARLLVACGAQLDAASIRDLIAAYCQAASGGVGEVLVEVLVELMLFVAFDRGHVMRWHAQVSDPISGWPPVELPPLTLAPGGRPVPPGDLVEEVEALAALLAQVVDLASDKALYPSRMEAVAKMAWEHGSVRRALLTEGHHVMNPADAGDGFMTSATLQAPRWWLRAVMLLAHTQPAALGAVVATSVAHDLHQMTATTVAYLCVVAIAVLAFAADSYHAASSSAPRWRVCSISRRAVCTRSTPCGHWFLTPALPTGRCSPGAHHAATPGAVMTNPTRYLRPVATRRRIY